MTGSPIQQRCWNHEDREASCRCPLCTRSFCRECVTEHESRLLCAACLNAISQQRAERRVLRRFAPAGLALAGIVLAWFVFYGVGEAFLESTARPEQPSWPSR
ncbi:MAG TPA: hypothetical protein VLY04_06700 [Bryobacteraceae bacterium]|nr:hypothetical protein [Bryobacteraceae bacterium]